MTNGSNLNEELGQIEYIFTDKTGTLTKNEMVFKKFCYRETCVDIDNFQRPKGSNEVLRLIALCHTCIIDPMSGGYSAPSPDDLALVQGACNLGTKFEGLDFKMCTKLDGEDLKILYVLGFTSERKRMSVVVEKPDG